MGQPNKASFRRGGAMVRPLAERLAIAREINAYRNAHPNVLVDDAIKACGYEGKVKQGAYWSWRKRLELADATRAANKGNGAAEPNGEVTEFPLAVIPERQKLAPRGKSIPRAREQADDDRSLAATLLEVAARLLRR